jgi:hypothetical protein
MITMLLAVATPPVDYMTVRRDLRPQEHRDFDAQFRRTERPALRDVLEAEQVVARFPCIGSIGRWQRVFSYSRNPQTFRLDTSLIHFDFRAVGHRGRPAGRRISTLADVQTGTDDAQFATAYGVYSIRTHEATLTYCGRNR